MALYLCRILSSSGEWHDYSRWIKDGGYSYSRDDLDSESSVRVKTGLMRRDKITEKYNASFDMLPMASADAARLDTDLRQAQFTAEIMTIYGPVTSAFYCSQFPAKLRQVLDENQLYWEDVSFNIHEI